MHDLKFLIHLLLTQPETGTRAIARRANVSYSSACRYVRLLRQHGGAASDWLKLNEDQLRRCLHRRAKKRPSEALHEKRLDQGLSLHELWLDYGTEHGAAAVSFSHFAKLMKDMSEQDFIRRVAREDDGGVDEAELWARCVELKSRTHAEARRRKRAARNPAAADAQARRQRHARRNARGRFTPNPPPPPSPPPASLIPRPCAVTAPTFEPAKGEDP